MKLTESRLRSIIREELSLLKERATVGKLEDILHGAFVAEANLDANRLKLDVEAKVEFNVEGAAMKIGRRQISLGELPPILEGSTIEYAAAHGNSQLELHVSNGYKVMITLSSPNADIYIRR